MDEQAVLSMRHAKAKDWRWTTFREDPPGPPQAALHHLCFRVMLGDFDGLLVSDPSRLERNLEVVVKWLRALQRLGVRFEVAESGENP